MRESWPSIWLGDLFSSVSYQRPVSCLTVCHNRQSASSIKHPRPSLSLPFQRSRALFLSLISSFFTKKSIPLYRPHEDHMHAGISSAVTNAHTFVHVYTIGANLWRFTHALIRGSRGWWEEANGRRRGACTWYAKIYDAGTSMCEDVFYIHTLHVSVMW